MCIYIYIYIYTAHPDAPPPHGEAAPAGASRMTCLPQQFADNDSSNNNNNNSSSSSSSCSSSTNNNDDTDSSSNMFVSLGGDHC